MILVAGCSYAHQYHNDYLLWPYMLNFDVVNLSRNGNSCHDIFESVNDYLSNNNSNNIKLSILSWTQWYREDYVSYGNSFENISDERMLELADISLQSIDKTNKLLDKYRIPKISFQMLNPMRQSMVTKYKNRIIDSIHKYKNLFIGYPGIEEFGGFNLYNSLQLYNHLRSDGHPNKKGNEILADTIYKYITDGNYYSLTEKIKL